MAEQSTQQNHFDGLAPWSAIPNRCRDLKHGGRLKSDKLRLNLAKKSAEAFRGYLRGHFNRLEK